MTVETSAFLAKPADGENPVTDEIYDYFGGNAAKKVEPIEDDDLEVLEASVADEQQADTVTQSQVEDPIADGVAEVKPEKAEQVDSWGSLLGELGIEDVAPKAKPVPAVTQKPAGDAMTASSISKKTKSDPAIQESEEKTVPDSGVDFLGLEPIPSPEEESVLTDMFAPSGAADFSESSGEGDSEESEYLEFEIEELDVSPYKEGEEESFGRRSRRRPQFNEKETEERDEPRAEKQERESRQSESRQSGSRQSGSRPSRSRDSRREEGTRSRRTSRKPNRDQEKSETEQSEFAAGIDVVPDSPAEVEKPKRSRRRSRGRGRSRDRDRERESETSNQVDSEPNAEFVDEIGWEVPQSKSSSEQESPESAVNDDSVDFTDESESESAGRSRPKRRRRRGGRSRSNRPSEERNTESESELSENATDLDVVQYGDDRQYDVDDRDVDDRDEDDRNEDDRNEDDRNEDDRNEDDRNEDWSRSSGRRPSRRGSRRNKVEESESQGTSSKRPKFPTWEEAVSGMIESNIKNHSRSSGRGGSGGRGRGRGRSGGRNAR